MPSQVSSNQRNRVYRTVETCMQMKLGTLLEISVDGSNLNAPSFPLRNQIVTALSEAVIALLTNSWHTWLIWRARLPTTVTPNNITPPVLNIAALSSLFWIVVSIIYQWPDLWLGKRLLQQAPTLPFVETRILSLISSAIIINWLLLYTLYHPFIENNNGVAKIILSSD
uniref:Uncharacterized protein n=1 Tax=Setaria digitata TaxID=48799 RepID=A0A915Q3M5_9BILA